MSCPTWCWKLISGLLQWSCNHQAIPPAFFLSPVLTLPGASTFTCFSCKSRAGRAGSRMTETVKEKALMKKPFICTKIQTKLPQLCPTVNMARWGLISAANLDNREEDTSAEVLPSSNCPVNMLWHHLDWWLMGPLWEVAPWKVVLVMNSTVLPDLCLSLAAVPVPRLLLKLFWGFLDGSDSDAVNLFLPTDLGQLLTTAMKAN